MRSALTLLLQSSAYALKLDRSSWDFAIEIQEIQRLGLSINDLRWLILKGVIAHEVEVSAPNSERREFRRTGRLSFYKRTCFVLTPMGVEWVRGRFADSGDDLCAIFQFDDESINQARPTSEAALDILLLPSGPPPSVEVASVSEIHAPSWDPDRLELRVGRSLVKKYKAPAWNQVRILSTFQEDGWPPRIDDPIPPRNDQDPKRRLHDTIISLNRHQQTPLVRFLGDGFGLGVRWEFNRVGG